MRQQILFRMRMKDTIYVKAKNNNKHHNEDDC